MKDNWSLLVLCTVTAIDMLGYGIIVPILPFYAEALGASPIELAVIIAAFPLAQSISYALLGRLSDRFGRRRLIVVGLALSAVSYVAFGFASSFSTLLLSRVGAGFGAGTFAVLQALAADMTDDKQRTAAMGYIGASYGVGLMLGPALASLTSVLGYSATGLAAALLAIVGAALAGFCLPRSARRNDHRSSRQPLGLRAWIGAYASWPLSVVVIVYLITLPAFEGVMSMLALFLERRISLGVQDAGFLWAWAGLITILSRVAIGRWSARVDDKAIILGGLGLLSSGVALLATTTNFWFGLLAVLPFATGYGLVFPTLASLASKLADDDIKGSILGGFLFLGGGGRIVGPIVAGLAFERIGIDLPMLLAALSFVLAALVTLAVPRQVRVPSQA
ncbi:MAG: MFS transporter [Rhodospirillales bacterium]|nr:MFS transporter [Rhodospirillales bacterium]